MKFTFAAAFFAVASGAAAPGTSSVSQSLPSPEVQSSSLKGYLRGGIDLHFARRLYPAEYYSSGCLGDQFKDKCAGCMCIEGGEGKPLQRQICDLHAPPDGKDHCVDKKPDGAYCSDNWECQSNYCYGPIKVDYAAPATCTLP